MPTRTCCSTRVTTGKLRPLFETARGAGTGCRLLGTGPARWEQAERSWRQAGDPRRAQVCSARLAEDEGRLEEAAAAWEALGDHPRAESLWKRAGAFDRLARSAFAAGRYAEAGELFEKARLGREAAAAWEKAKRVRARRRPSAPPGGARGGRPPLSQEPHLGKGAALPAAARPSP